MPAAGGGTVLPLFVDALLLLLLLLSLLVLADAIIITFITIIKKISKK